MSTPQQPSFFIVGAPRCGTTALADFLNQHPDIYIPYIKEPHFFGADLTVRRGFHTLEEYLVLFEDARPDQICGEGSTWYLRSHEAAKEIADYNPDSKIIIMLRNPIDLIYSWHGFALYAGDEEIDEFAEALAAEDDRRAGRRIPKDSAIEKLLYHEIPMFVDQIARYQARFPKEQIHIIIHDDFRQQQETIVKQVYHFLGADPDFVPEMGTVNAHRKVRNKFVHQIITNQPPLVRQMVKAVTPRKLRTKVYHSLREMNTTTEKRSPMTDELRAELNDYYRPEVERLSEMLKRDLTHWTA